MKNNNPTNLKVKTYIKELDNDLTIPRIYLPIGVGNSENVDYQNICTNYINKDDKSIEELVDILRIDRNHSKTLSTMYTINREAPMFRQKSPYPKGSYMTLYIRERKSSGFTIVATYPSELKTIDIELHTLELEMQHKTYNYTKNLKNLISSNVNIEKAFIPILNVIGTSFFFKLVAPDEYPSIYIDLFNLLSCRGNESREYVGRFLSRLVAYPLLETIAKSGLSKIVQERLMEHTIRNYLVNREATNIREAYALPKRLFKLLNEGYMNGLMLGAWRDHIIKNGKLPCSKDLDMFYRVIDIVDNLETKYNVGYKRDVLQAEFESLFNGYRPRQGYSAVELYTGSLEEFGVNLELQRVVEYLHYTLPLTQAFNLYIPYRNKEAFFSSDRRKTWNRTYKDYLTNVTASGCTNFSKYPKSLKLAHDIAVANNTLNIDKELSNNLQSHQMKILNYENVKVRNNPFFFFVPLTAEDFINEGNLMHNCVKSYVGAVSLGSKSILSMRRLTSPKKPYANIEIIDGVVVQALGTYNSDLSGEALKHLTSLCEACGVDPGTYRYKETREGN